VTPCGRTICRASSAAPTCSSPSARTSICRRKAGISTHAQAARLAREAGVRRLVPTHFYFDPDDERLGERLATGYGGEITVARDGLTIE
jgi:hypothetical protein